MRLLTLSPIHILAKQFSAVGNCLLHYRMMSSIGVSIHQTRAGLSPSFDNQEHLQVFQNVHSKRQKHPQLRYLRSIPP